MMHPEVRSNPPRSRRTNPPTTVLLARRIDALPERVFDAFLDPQKVATWMLASSPDDEIASVAIDPRVGGTFSFLVRRQGHEVDHIGGYVEIDRPRRLGASSPGIGTLVTLDFAPAGTGTELRLTHEGVPEDQARRTEDGWSKIIQAIANTVTP